ncbi:hypothetical protein evm_003595 [Chilo suppressalis]|uniref:Adipokinetic hormone 3 n=1 Tax=Chilo suppressalis TaxID=168631 RepID=A0A0S1U1R9_CHISP|nr:adipokinetic hormone 3 precursor [Chilo suppressalis]RVE51792.1 hypothetical protein evm_003595 [Chilo suppressalis]
MNTIRCRGVTVVVVFAVLALVSAQITFSRDWTGGKRAAPQLAIDCGQFTRLCRHFVHELKQAMTSEAGGKRRREDDKAPPVYDDDK